LVRVAHLAQLMPTNHLMATTLFFRQSHRLVVVKAQTMEPETTETAALVAAAEAETELETLVDILQRKVPTEVLVRVPHRLTRLAVEVVQHLRALITPVKWPVTVAPER